MGTSPQPKARVTRGLLTKSEREFLRGERDVEDPDGYRRNVRYRVRQRVKKIDEDLEILRESDNEDIVDEIMSKFGRVERLERELERLRAELDQSDSK